MYVSQSARQQPNRKVAERRQSRLKRFGLAAVPAAFLLAISIASTPAYAAPFTLTDTHVYNLADPDSTLTLEPFVCPPRPEGRPTSGGFTVNYTLRSGFSEGAYSGTGTYVETGSVTVGTEPVSGTTTDYYVTSQTINFQIKTPNNNPVIKGTKTLRPNDAANGVLSVGECQDGFVALALKSTYNATLNDNGTVYTDRGLTSTSTGGNFGANNGNYESAFDSDLDTPNNIGHVTGAGKYGDKTSFRFNVRSTKKAIKATCTIKDRSAVPAITVKCLDAVSVTRTNDSYVGYVVKGNATVNGQPTTYEMQIFDGTPDGDVFGLSLGTGYTRSGIVTDGSIDVVR